MVHRPCGRPHLQPDRGAAWQARLIDLSSRKDESRSGLDLALESESALDPNVLGNVAEALSESDLPYKVDVIDLRFVDPAFRALIEPDMIALTF